MCGTAARIMWNALVRLIARIASHFSGGKSAIPDTYWMPALLTTMSGPPQAACARSTIAAISSGFVMSAPSCSASAPLATDNSPRIASIASASPKPFSITAAPSAASARAMARPMPDVEPVTIALLPFRNMALVSPDPIAQP